MRQNSQTNTKRTQRARLFQLLKDRAGEWIPAFEIAATAGLQYSARIFEQRAAGAVISNRREYHNGQTISWFRLEQAPRPMPAVRPAVESQRLFDISPERHRDNG